MWQGPYANPSVSSLSLDKSKQSDSPNGKITPAVLFLLMANRHFLVKFWKCQKAVSACLMRQNHCWNYFAFNQSYLAKGKIAPAVPLPHEAKEKWMILHWRLRTGSDWWFSKILLTGLDWIQFYWIRTELGLKNFIVRSSLLDSQNRKFAPILNITEAKIAHFFVCKRTGLTHRRLRVFVKMTLTRVSSD